MALKLEVVTKLKYESRKEKRSGLCTSYLCEELGINKDKLNFTVHRAAKFKLPEDNNTDIIMVGPGTGIAPFVAFLQERVAKEAKGANWLFFGERNRSQDFFYEDFLQDLVSKDLLLLDLAFSRDQEHKIYVQDRMYERAADLWQWLESGAHLYVCGDAKHMAKDVDSTLLQVIREQGNLSLSEARDYIKFLRHNDRYQRDVY